MPSEASWAICHYEDEPQRVDLPNLIEIALFQHPDFGETTIQVSEDDRTYRLSFLYAGRPNVLYYFIRETLVEMRERLASAEPACSVILNMVDMSLSGHRHAGASIVQKCLSEGVSGALWMLTGYPMEAQRILQEQGLNVRIVAKPYYHSMLRDEIVNILIAAMNPPEGDRLRDD